MKFGIFYELQLPRPWQDGDEHRLYQNALAQLELDACTGEFQGASGVAGQPLLFMLTPAK